MKKFNWPVIKSLIVLLKLVTMIEGYNQRLGSLEFSALVQISYVEDHVCFSSSMDFLNLHVRVRIPERWREGRRVGHVQRLRSAVCGILRHVVRELGYCVVKFFRRS